MNSEAVNMFFALIRSAIHGEKLVELKSLSSETFSELVTLAESHDLSHLIVSGAKEKGLSIDASFEKLIFKAIYNYERLNLELKKLCEALEEGEIPFVPLKGSVLRKYYKKPWMRTSCDIDVLVRKEDLEKTLAYLTKKLSYVKKGQSAHDVSLYSKSGVHVEIHHDLVEDKRANNASVVLGKVWDNVALSENSKYRYEMSDAFFYFYHVAHMAKHFETGGCGIRPFIDLWILDSLEGADTEGRDKLLAEAELSTFAERVRTLSRVWLEDCEMDEFSKELQKFILGGGVYGSSENRVALSQKKSGGRVKYLLSRIFATKEKLAGYYPIVNKHPWLIPFMQIRRWCFIFRPNVARMAKGELRANAKKDDRDEFLNNMGL